MRQMSKENWAFLPWRSTFSLSSMGWLNPNCPSNSQLTSSPAPEGIPHPCRPTLRGQLQEKWQSGMKLSVRDKLFLSS